jgi:hypothetical protein
MKHLQESRRVQMPPYDLTMGVELNLHSCFA